MSNLQKYVAILEKLYTTKLNRVEDHKLRDQLLDIWPYLSLNEQDTVQAHSLKLRKR